MLVAAGIKDIDKLQEIGELIYDEASSLWDRGRESGLDDCGCDGCCDDYVYYDDHRDAVREAKEEGEEEGYERGRADSESEIEDLKSRIEELESQLNETVNKKNTKRI
jgi:flagellar biosynthesis/type III secretory pathway protein FliH